jgi:predicted nucleic acid-binding protein
VIVLDTNVVSEILRPRPDLSVVAVVDAWDPGDLAITAVTLAELLAGVALLPRNRRRSSLSEQLGELLDEAFADSILPFDAGSAQHYSDALATRRKAGAPISVVDAQIAAICLQHEAALATRNGRDFAGLGLTLLDPWAA